MDAFSAMDDDLFGPTTSTTVRKPHYQEQQQQQQQQHFLRKMDSSSSIDLIDNEVEASAFSDAHHQLLTRYTGIQAEAEEGVILSEQQKHQQQQQVDSSPRLNNSSSNNNNNSNNVSADPTDSKETCKDAGSWSTQATSVLLDVFREKRIAVNGRNFRGEEWDELAIGVNEKCHQHLMANGSSGSSFSPPSAAAAAAAAAKDQWKTAKQCSYKMSNLKRKYKSEKEMLQLSGPKSVSAWQWFSKMDGIFSSDPKYAVLGSGTQQARLDIATASLAAAAADFFDDELMLNNVNKNNSKSTSATNNSPSPSRQHQNETANSPRCMSELHVRKKQCLGNNNNNIYASSGSPGSNDFVMPASYADSMKLMLVQQKETIQLLRELVSIKQHNRGQDQDSSELLGSTTGLLDLRQKIESVDRELMQLKLIYEAKEREFKDAMLAYEEKCRVKDDLIRRLTEAALCKERRRNRMPEANTEPSM